MLSIFPSNFSGGDHLLNNEKMFSYGCSCSVADLLGDCTCSLVFFFIREKIVLKRPYNSMLVGFLCIFHML